MHGDGVARLREFGGPLNGAQRALRRSIVRVVAPDRYVILGGRGHRRRQQHEATPQVVSLHGSLHSHSQRKRLASASLTSHRFAEVRLWQIGSVAAQGRDQMTRVQLARSLSRGQRLGGG